MYKTADDLVADLPPGQESTCGPEVFGMNLEQFQDVVSRLRQLEKSGSIALPREHAESQTGSKYVDFIRVRRIS